MSLVQDRAADPPAGHRGHWVLLRGLTRDRRHWGDFPQQLQQALQQGRVGGASPQRSDDSPEVLTPDLAGNGARWAERSPGTVAGMVEDLRQELARQGAQPPYRLLALSLGGMVAIEWARRQPQELRSLHLVNTSVRPWSPLWQRLRPQAWPTVLGALLRPTDARGLQRRVLTLTSRRWSADSVEGQALLAQWVQWQRDCPVQAANVLRQLWAAARFRAPVSPPACAVFVQAGQGDDLVNPACSQALAQAWGVPLWRHPWAGHDLPLDDPQGLIQRLLLDL